MAEFIEQQVLLAALDGNSHKMWEMLRDFNNTELRELREAVASIDKACLLLLQNRIQNAPLG